MILVKPINAQSKQIRARGAVPRRAEADGDKLPPSQFLMWATFNDCNFRCKYCPIPDELLRPPSDAFKRFYDRGYHDKILSFFRRLHEHSGSWIVCLTGGEPLLMPNLEYLASNLIQIGHKLRYNTNMSINLLRRPEWFAANPPSGIDLLMVSIHDESIPQIECFTNASAI